MTRVNLFYEAQKNHQKGKILEALRIYELIIEKKPKEFRPRIYKSLALVQLGRNSEALNQIQLALKYIKSPIGSDWSTVGVIFKNLGRISDAEIAFKKAEELLPENGGIKSNIGLVQMIQGKYDDALISFSLAEKIIQNDVAPTLNKARIYFIQKSYEDAIHSLRKAKDISPGHPEIGIIEAEINLLDHQYINAFKSVISSLELNPINYEGWQVINRIGVKYCRNEELNRVSALVCNMKPTSGRLLSLIAGILRKNLAWKYLSVIELLLQQALINKKDIAVNTSAIFQLLSCNISQLAHKRCAEASWHSNNNQKRTIEFKHHTPKSTTIRLGILSSDIRSHAVGYLVIGVLESLSKRQGIELYIYSNIDDDGSEIRERAKIVAHKFVNVKGMDFLPLANRIREDKVDVILDLNGMTAETMIPVMHYKPAPITMTWLGMPGTIGYVDDIHYLIADKMIVDKDNYEGFSEKIIFLNRSYQPNDISLPAKLNLNDRVAEGLPINSFVFCSFNQLYKYSPETLNAWVKILETVKDSVLWILATDEESRQKVKTIFTNSGIDSTRIIFANKAAHSDHVKRISLADLMLDNWPYNAHTTCSDALRVGVPVITLKTKTFAGRVAASILQSSNLSEWITTDIDEYISKSIKYASKSRSEIEKTKLTILYNYKNGKMTDCDGFAKNLHDSFKFAINKYLANEEPNHFYFDEFDEVREGLPFYSNIISDSNELVFANESDNSPEIVDPIIDELFQIQKLFGITPPMLVDIGAAAIDGEIGYEYFTESGLFNVIGFEPSDTAYKVLEAMHKDNPHYHIINKAVGDGKQHTLNICHAEGMNSCLVPNFSFLKKIPKFEEWARVVDQKSIETHRLDDIDEIKSARFLKLDIQGFEYNVLENAREFLNAVMVIHIELSPFPLYQGEKSMFEVGYFLEQNGFVLHYFSNLNKRGFKPYFTDQLPFGSKNHLLQVDAVFIRNYDQWDYLPVTYLKEMAFILHALYKSYDLVTLLLKYIDERDSSNLMSQYIKKVS